VSEATEGLGAVLLELLKQVSPKSAKKLSESDAQQVVEALLEDAVAQRWITEQMAQVGIRAAEYRNGTATMELEPAREMVAMWVGACRGLIGTGPNYSETVLTDRVDHLANRGDKVEMGVKVAESPDKYVITVQRDAFDAITPHDARMRAERWAEELSSEVWGWIIAVNDGAGYDADDLIQIMERLGFPPPPDPDEEQD
jgi:hypothetical protein